jgi:L-rhamnose mutarotase
LTVRVCFVLHVRADRLDAYRERHRNVWPEMLDALRETGWRNYSLFLHEDGMLVGYLECDDFEAALQGMEAREVNARWQAEMAPFFELPESARPDTGFVRLEEVFHLD